MKDTYIQFYNIEIFGVKREGTIDYEDYFTLDWLSRVNEGDWTVGLPDTPFTHYLMGNLNYEELNRFSPYTDFNNLEGLHGILGVKDTSNIGEQDEK
jgi:hypothetical protein